MEMRESILNVPREEVLAASGKQHQAESTIGLSVSRSTFEQFAFCVYLDKVVSE